ncbi:hypothetical protein L4C36_15210 [Photobacterium japonica]|uniref:hypothetical protein n=1 Tax=Photobacterium japonica TaxID=2910235 RepID=UPI003D0C7109
MKKTLSLLLLLCASWSAYADVSKADGWHSNNMQFQGNDMLTILNNNSIEGSSLQLVFDKKPNQCLSSLSIVFGGYENEAFTRHDLNCVVESGRGDTQYSETFMCSGIGSEDNGILLFNLILDDDSKARLFAGIEGKDALSFHVVEAELREVFDMVNAPQFFEQGLSFCTENNA